MCSRRTERGSCVGATVCFVFRPFRLSIFFHCIATTSVRGEGFCLFFFFFGAMSLLFFPFFFTACAALPFGVWSTIFYCASCNFCSVRTFLISVSYSCYFVSMVSIFAVWPYGGKAGIIKKGSKRSKNVKDTGRRARDNMYFLFMRDTQKVSSLHKKEEAQKEEGYHWPGWTTGTGFRREKGERSQRRWTGERQRRLQESSLHPLVDTHEDNFVMFYFDYLFNVFLLLFIVISLTILSLL